MKCGQCDQSCSLSGHLKGDEVKRDAGAITFECRRCGIQLEQCLCELCGVEVGGLVASETDSAVDAAARVAARAKKKPLKQK